MDVLVETFLRFWQGLSLKTGLIATLVVVLASAERLRPSAERPEAVRRDGGGRVARNVALWAGNAVLSVLFVVPLTVFAAANAFDWRPGWSRSVLVDVLVLDLWVYLWHRANHEVPFLWRFHRVHHHDRFLDVSTGARFHPGEVALSAVVRAVVVLALAIPLAHVIVFEATLLAAALFQHSNLRLPAPLERALSRVIVTPSIHWVHHHANRRDTDSNYATILSLWDRLFGTASPTQRRPDMPIGLEGVARDRGLAGLLILPFGRG